jgi:hypothetical protein
MPNGKDPTTSTWGDLGCQRGTFQTVEKPVLSCLFSSFSQDDDSDFESWDAENKEEAIEERREALVQMDRLWLENNLERDEALGEIGKSINVLENSLSPPDRQLRTLFSMCFLGSRFCNLDRQCSPECIPLNECILAIAWDSATTSLGVLATLLPRAATYQADHQEASL